MLSKNLFMSLGKVAGAPTSPNGITMNSYFPKLVENDVFTREAGSIGTCQYPLARSKIVIYFAEDISSKSSLLG